MGAAMLRAGLTGLFCAIFAYVMFHIAPLLPALPVIAVSFVSGFLGSLFASAVLARKLRRNAQSAETGRAEVR